MKTMLFVMVRPGNCIVIEPYVETPVAVAVATASAIASKNSMRM